MNSVRLFMGTILFAGAVLTASFTGCARQLTPFTPGGTPTFTALPTSTPTISPTPFSTPPTATVTATLTMTATPVSTYALIDDFAGTGGSGSDSVSQIFVIQDENGHWRDGHWFVTNDVAVTTILSGPGRLDANSIEQNITFNPSGTSGFDQLAFTFTDPNGTKNAGVTYYDATVGGLYTGISFWAKIKTMPSTICGSTVPFWVNFVDNGPVTDHQVAVPFTTSWQQFTVYFNQAGWDQLEDGSSTALNPVSIQAVKFSPQNLGTNNFNVDFLVDDIQLVGSAAPAAPAAPSPNLLSDFQDGGNHLVFNNTAPFYAGSSSGRSGYWYVFADAFGQGTTQCPDGTVNGTAFFPDSPGNGGAQDLAAHIVGTLGAACTVDPYDTCPFAAVGFNFVKPAGPYDATAWSNDFSHGIQFYAKWGATNGVGGVWLKFPQVTTSTVAEGGNCVGGGVNGMGQTLKCDDHYCYELTNGAQITTSWQLIQIPMATPILQQQGWSNWTATWDPTTLLGIQWEFDNTFAIPSGTSNYDLWVDDVSFY